ncbi:MAG: xanthine dehydrogenase family protein subunit M [Amylibacter sp.]|nr:xanthine dehydrogenase family protein subunit M [Amylibacter sp.]
MTYLEPKTLDHALEMLGQSRVSLIAGGTDFFPSMGEGAVTGDLLDLTRIAELQGITETKQGWRIGAAVTWSNLINTKLPPAFDGLKQAACEVGSVQIQNAATVVGNLCNASPAADGVPPLLALDAEIEIASSTSSRQIKLSDFITGVRQIDLNTNELVTAIHIPAIEKGTTSAFIKLGSRRYLVISIAMVAVVLSCEKGRITRARVAVGACSAIATRLFALEKALEGAQIDTLKNDALVTDQHLAELNPLSDIRGSAEYRVEAVKELCHRTLLQAAPKGTDHG